MRSSRATELADLIEASGGTAVAQEDGGLAVTGLGADAIGELAAGHQIALQELVPRHASLETAYLDLTEGSTEFGAGNQVAADLTSDGSAA